MRFKSSCSVSVCKNPVPVKDACGINSVTYHSFPKDEEMRKVWVKACKREKDSINPEHAKICSRHFRPEDYKHDFINEMLGLAQRRAGFLKPGAVPSLLLDLEYRPMEGNCEHSYAAPFVVSLPPPPSQRAKRHAKRVQEKQTSSGEDKIITESLFESTECQELDKLLDFEMLDSSTGGHDDTMDCELSKEDSRVEEKDFQGSSQEPCDSLKEEVHNLKAKLNAPCSSCDLLKQDIQYLRARLKTKSKECNRLRKKLAKPKDDLVKNELLKRFSKSQTNFLLGKKVRPGNWTEGEIKSALELRKISLRCYKYIRNMKLMPLPGVSTLRNWNKNFES